MRFAILALLLAGCQSAGLQGMSAEQITATARMKDANVNCIIINSPWGRGVTTFVNLDKGVVPSGGITVDNECKITILNNPVPPK